MSLGQANLFAPEAGLPLRRRVEVALVDLADVRGILRHCHYLGRSRTGRQLNYSVSVDGVIDGVVTYAYPMMSAPLEGVPSDQVLEFARLFLKSNVPHVASCAIGKTLRRVEGDWKGRFPEAPPVQLVVSWSDTEYHVGTVYRAANFAWLRKSKRSGLGHHRGKDKPRTKHADFKHEKDCWIYWLDPKRRNEKPQ
jgi:hypothetical protein